MRWLLLAVAYPRAFLSTLQYARYMPTERRQKIAERITRLAKLRGWDTLASDRLDFSLATVEEAPAATPMPTPEPASIADMYFLPVSAGIIIAIVVIGILIILMLRRR